MRFIILCTVVLAAAVLPGSVVAQDNSTATPAPTSTPDQPAADVSIGPLTKVIDWRYRGGTFTITVEARASTLLTLSESPGPSSGDSGTIRFVRQRLSSGTNTVTVDVPPSNGEAVVILSTPASVNNGEAAFLRATTDDDLLDGPPSDDDVRDAVLGGGLGTGLGALLVIVRRRFGLHRGMRREA